MFAKWFLYTLYEPKLLDLWMKELGETVKPRKKRKSKGWRKHIRRVKAKERKKLVLA